MFGLEAIIDKYLSNGTVTYGYLQILGMVLLIIINAGLSVAKSVKKKEFEFDKVIGFLIPLLQYLLLLFVLEIPIVLTKNIQWANYIFVAAQFGVWISIVVYYIVQCYTKLKELGMPTSKMTDDIIDNIEDKIGDKVAGDGGDQQQQGDGVSAGTNQ